MIRLQFVRQAALSSDAIAWFSQGNLSHVDAVVGLEGNPLAECVALLGARSDTTGGRPPGVQIRRLDYLPFALRVRFNIPCTEDQAAEWRAFLVRQLGKPYDHAAIWGFVVGRNWRERDSWICSELQAAALEQAGIVKDLYLAANKITPVALALAVSALPGVTRSTWEPQRTIFGEGN